MLLGLTALLRILLPYKKNLFFNICSNIFASIFTLLSVALFLPVLEMIFSQDLDLEKLKEYAAIELNFGFSSASLKIAVNQLLAQYILGAPSILEGKFQALLMICGLIATAFLLKNIFTYLSAYSMIFVRFHLIEDYRQKLYKKILSLDLSYFTYQRKGDLLSRFSNDVNEINVVSLQILEAYFKDFIGLVITLIFLFQINVQLTLFVFLFVPISGFAIGRLGRSLKKDNHQVQNFQSQLLTHLEESIAGMRIIQIFTAEKTMQKKFLQLQKKYTAQIIGTERRKESGSPFSEFAGILVVCVIILYGGKLVFEDKIGSSEFILFIGLFYNLITHIKGFAQSFFITKKGLASLERLNAIFDQKTNIFGIAPIISPIVFEKELLFKNISFTYEEKPILQNISLQLPKGKKIALVGASGSGKSTIAALIPRFYEVSEGEILVDGVNIRHFEPETWRKKIGLVSQETLLFHDTIFNNIAFGNEKASEQAIIQAAKIAHAHAFIMELPEGYHTSIGEAGAKLSGGQRQRIAIARAILKDPVLLILDEATSALDTQSERIVQEALEDLMRNRTSLIIAHRLSTIVNADQIIVLEQGKIIEQGTHEELLNKKGAYYRLYQTQENKNN